MYDVIIGGSWKKGILELTTFFFATFREYSYFKIKNLEQKLQLSF